MPQKDECWLLTTGNGILFNSPGQTKIGCMLSFLGAMGKGKYEHIYGTNVLFFSLLPEPSLPCTSWRQRRWRCHGMMIVKRGNWPSVQRVLWESSNVLSRRVFTKQEALKWVASVTVWLILKLYFISANLNLKTRFQFSYWKMFKYVWNNLHTWIYFLAVNFMKSKDRFPVKIFYPNCATL